jgi:hypothetical protein
MNSNFGQAIVKQEGTTQEYDEGRPYSLWTAQGRLKRFVRWLTHWAWEPEVSHWEQAVANYYQKRAIAHLKTLQLSLLEQLFREKQGKITRLQQAYTNKTRVLYEDLRKENVLSNTEAIAQTISVLATRAELMRERTGKPWPHSDGTVMGVPGDRPNVETGAGW